MTDLTSFHLFPELPTELRLKVWEHAIEPRILQLGIKGGAPFPFLDYVGPRRRELAPIRTFPPSLFSVCSEAREISRPKYIPFGYTIIHPQLDILYISRRAAKLLYMNSERLDDRLGPPLYCIAMFERVAIEVDFADTPEELQRGTMDSSERGIYRMLAYDYGDALTRFGPPKELLLARGAPRVKLSYSGPYDGTLGWEEIKLLELQDEVDVSGQRLMDYMKRVLMELRARRGSWLHWRMPRIRIVDAERVGDVIERPETQNGTNLWLTTDRVSKNWKRSEYNGSVSPWQRTSNPYDREHVEEALSSAGIRWRLEA